MSQETVIRINALSKRYGDTCAVDNLNLEVRENEILGLLGPNGAGKTTTIRMICGLLKPDAGTISLLGPGGNPSVQTSSRIIGICPQELVIWDFLTCEEQLRFTANMYRIPATKAKKAARSLLERLGLADKRHKLANTLSGGMKRRLNLALSLVHDPEIVILDEPEAGLDPQSRILVRDFIRSLAEKKAVIFTTHNMDEADRICDRVAIIDHGKILMTAPPRELKSKSLKGNVIEAIFDSDLDSNLLKRKLSDTLGDQILKIDYVNDRLLIHVKDPIRYLANIIRVLTEAGIQQHNIVFRWVTLEDVFIDLTGRSLRE